MQHITTIQEGPIVINRLNEKVSIEELMAEILEHVNDWLEKPVIWVLEELDLGAITKDQLRIFAKDLARKSLAKKGKKTAIVTTNDLQFGLMRMFDSFANIDNFHITFSVLRDMEEAKKWLLES